MGSQSATERVATKSTVRVAAKAGLFSFVFVMYSYTTAGPFGLEDQVTTSGPGLTLLYHLLVLMRSRERTLADTERVLDGRRR